MNKEAAPAILAGVRRSSGDVGQTAIDRMRLVNLAKLPWRLLLIVVAPTFLAAIYYLFIAAPIYVSTAEFVIHTKTASASTAGIGSMLSSVGLSASDQQVQAYEVQDYILSRNMTENLARTVGLRDMLSRPEGDIVFRYPPPFFKDNIENLYQAYQRFVKVNYDLQSGITTLTVEAFRPEDAQRLATALLARSEDRLNVLNENSLADAVAQSQHQVADAEAQVVAAQTALTVYRNGSKLIDPDKSAASDLALIQQLQFQEATLKAQRAALAESAPQSPQLALLDKQIGAFADQAQAEQARTAGQANSLAPEVARFEKLTLDRDVAGKYLDVALGGLESARLNARQQQEFLDRIVSPTLPDKAIEPQRFLLIFLIFVTCMVIYAIVSLVGAGLREHQQR
jgi:capsular polysaccharide transport system permease protein